MILENIIEGNKLDIKRLENSISTYMEQIKCCRTSNEILINEMNEIRKVLNENLISDDLHEIITEKLNSKWHCWDMGRNEIKTTVENIVRCKKQIEKIKWQNAEIEKLMEGMSK